MCKVSSIILQSAGCLLLLNGELAHKWTKWTYQLCSISQDSRLCGNEENLNSLGDDYGYRSGSCLVCDNEQRARSNYEAALAAAQNQYNLVVNAAWSQRLEEEFHSLNGRSDSATTTTALAASTRTCYADERIGVFHGGELIRLFLFNIGCNSIYQLSFGNFH